MNRTVAGLEQRVVEQVEEINALRQELADIQEREIVLLAQLIRKTRQNFPDIAAWSVPKSQPSWWDQP